MNNFDDLFIAGGEKNESKSEHSFNKEEWAAKKQQERTDAFELLDTATKEAVENCETFRDYLLVQSRFGRYSVSNALLIAYQNNEATLAGAACSSDYRCGTSEPHQKSCGCIE